MQVKKYLPIVTLLYILSGCVHAALGQGSPQNVIWTNVVNATATGNTLQKNSGCDGCADAGATSQQNIASGDGYMEFTVGALAGQRFAGLSNGNSGAGFTEIDFAFRLWGNSGPGNLDVQENGTYRFVGATYVVGDVLRVAVESGVVKYYKNGALLYTSTVAPVYPLQVDTSLLTANSAVNSAVIFIPSSATQNVIWTNVVNATATGNTLQKNAGCDGCADAGATSQQTITSGDGYTEFTVGALAGQRFAGLSNGNSGAGFTEIDFAFRLWGNSGPGNLDVQENGTYRFVGATYVVGDVLRVAVESGVVKYYKNGVLLYTSTVAPVYPLLVDTSLLTANAAVNNAVISTASAPPTSSLPAPVNAPRAHPLAPNPHTSVGLFWIYTNPTTGRQWTGGTYKVKRCSGASCTPTTVVATGLTNADFQDTGLTANTTYGYRYVANDGADTSDSPTVYITTLASDSNMVQFPDTVWNQLLGPLPEVGQIPFTWYNSTATTNGQIMIAKFPFVAPFALQGTGTISNNSTTITGTGTFFLEQVAANNPTCTNHIKINGVDAGTIASVNSNTSITLTSQWTGGAQTNVSLSTNVKLCGHEDPINDYLVGNQLYYYDSPMALWQLYFRTGDPQYMRGAIKGSESVFAGYMRLGRNRVWNTASSGNDDDMPAPRNFQFSGYALLGMAGRSDVWDLLDDFLTKRYPTWISNFRGGNNDFRYTREKAYMILFTSWFVTSAPDSFKRSDGTTTTANGSVTVDGSLVSGRKGWWRSQLETDLPGLITDDQAADGLWFESSAYDDYGDGDMPFAPGTSQPFIGGLTADALGYCWRNTHLSTTARNAARKLVLKHAAALGLRSYNTNIAADDTGFRWRSIHYFLGGGTRLNPHAFQFGSDSSILNNTPDNNMIAQHRQAIPLMLTTFGWAYEMSGHTWYKTIGDEMMNAAFAQVGEDTGGIGDGKKSLCDALNNFKDYGQCYRTSARYFGHRLASPAPLGTAPVVTMPLNQTLTGGVNQVSLTAAVSCTNTPCTYKWGLVEYPLVMTRQAAMPVFHSDDALTTKLSGLEPGTYKVLFYALDNLGLEGHGDVTITVGDGVFLPIVAMHKDGAYSGCTTATSTTFKVIASSAAGRSLTHVFTGFGPKDQPAPTVTPSGTPNSLTVTLSGLSPGWWVVKDVVTDSAGASRTAYFTVAVHPTKCGDPFSQPSTAHNTVPFAAAPPNHRLPAGSTSTQLYFVPIDPEGWSGFAVAAPGYTGRIDGSKFLVTALTHSVTQTAGPVTATITGANTVRPTITGLTASGTYTFRYTGTDQQGDSVQVSVNVIVP